MGLYLPCLRDGGRGAGGTQTCDGGQEGEGLKAILLRWEAGWKQPSFLAFCHQVTRKLHDQ